MPLDDFVTNRPPAILTRNRAGVTVAQFADDGPTRERRQHARVDRGWREGKEEGRAHRVRDSITFMHQQGRLSVGQFEAATRFRRAFERATGFGIATVALEKPRAPSRGGQDMPASVLDAANHVHAAVKRLGGPGSVAARVVVGMCGRGITAKDLSASLRAEGIALDLHHVVGALVAALSVIERR